jgi:hypothetical protein
MLYHRLIFSRLYLPQGTAEGSMVLKRQTDAAAGDIKVCHLRCCGWGSFPDPDPFVQVQMDPDPSHIKKK